MTSSESAVTSSESAVLVVGAGDRTYREMIFESLSALPIWLLTHREPSWERRHIRGSTVLPRLSTAQVSSRLDFIDPVVTNIAKQMPLSGVLTFEELYTPIVCRIADLLGLPNFGADAVENCRDKHRTRVLLAEAGLPQPQSDYAEDATEAARLAERFGYPVVVKPRGLAGSIGVLMATNPAELAGALDITLAAAATGAQRHAGGVLVEQLIEGCELSVDCAVVAGTVTPLFLAHKRVAGAPYFEEIGQLVDAADPLLTEPAIVSTLNRAHEVLGIQTGMTHTELKLSPEGPVIIEVNARAGGDLVPHTARGATGIDPALVAAQVATGTFTGAPATRHRVCASELVYPPRAGTIAEVILPDPAAHPNLAAAVALVGPGDQVALPPEAYLDRCAYAITTGDDVESCVTALQAAVRDLRVVLK
jgi:biotin carboxylase